MTVRDFREHFVENVRRLAPARGMGSGVLGKEHEPEAALSDHGDRAQAEHTTAWPSPEINSTVEPSKAGGPGGRAEIEATAPEG